MKRRTKRSRAPAEWQRYDDLEGVKTITVGEGIDLLVRNWPKETSKTAEDIRKRVRERAVSAIRREELRAIGDGLGARMSPAVFFEWAVCWEDRRGRSDQQSAMQAAASNFGAPNIGRLNTESLSCSLSAVIVEEPRDCEEAKAMARDYQIKYLEALEEADRLRREVASLKPYAEAYREMKDKQRASGRKSGGRRIR
jgi:hypothetical protein